MSGLLNLLLFFANYPNLLEYLLIIISTCDLSKLCNRCDC